VTVNYSIPSQVILASTITKPKGLRSVINKVLMQICAKIGGEPWAIDNMPFTGCPTMVVGIDQYNKDNKTIIGCCASYNRTFSKYLSSSALESQGNDLGNKIAECIVECAGHFNKICKVYPKHIIVIRDGLNSMKTAQNEAAIINSKLESAKMTYLLINKKNNLKVFACENNKYSNIPPGTLVDDVVVNPEHFDFFLISQKSTQGLSAATHYHVVFDTFKVNTNDLHSFMYKLCYLYYNWTGGIRVPAPCQYAKKLAFLIGDKISSKGKMNLPNEKFMTDIRSLYFL